MKFTLATKWRVVVVAIALALATPSRAADARETNIFAQAAIEFNGGFYLQAELTFSNFVATFTNSPLRPAANLYIGRARMGQSNYPGALEVLEREMPSAGNLAFEYVFRIAEAYYGKADYANTELRCRNLLQSLPADSPLRLGVAYLQARACSQLQEWPKVCDLLSKTNGDFQFAARAAPASSDAVNGILLLGEAYLKQRQYADATNAILRPDPQVLSPESKWQQQYLLCRILLDAGSAEQSLVESTNLVARAATQAHRIETTSLRGEILERLNRPADALAVYTNNLDASLPAAANRNALDKTIQLTLQLGQTNDAIQRLNEYVARRPNDANLDLARLFLGELSLTAYFAATTNNPDQLQAAITNLDLVQRSSPLYGKARLERGWCDWQQHAYTNAATDFDDAIAQLPHSEDQAVAIFKYADCLFRGSNYAQAVTNYHLLINSYRDMPAVTNSLFDLALYQIVQASVQLGDESTATDAADKIDKWFPDSGFGEQGKLLLGEDLDRKNNFRDARSTYSSVLEKNPNTALAPDLRFRVARTYDLEGDWTNAASAYDNWVNNTNYAANPLMPQVQFYRALVTGKAGMESNALVLMSNYVSHFPATPFAPQAQNWIGDYFMNHGDYENADSAYQEIYKSSKFTNAGPIAYQARLMAGRAASKRQDLHEAEGNFSDLISDTNAPPPILAEAYFQLGYTRFQIFQQTGTNFDLLKDADNYLSRATNYPSLAPQAFGQLGDCNLAWALKDTNFYAFATNMYLTVLNLPQATISDRSQAEFGLGKVAERIGHPDEALVHYFNLIPATLPTDPTQCDPFWVKEAGVAAARLCESRKQWDKARIIYGRVAGILPTLGPEMERNIANADRQSAAESR